MTSVYGYCPICGAPVELRERRLNGNDTCRNSHVFPSREAKRAEKQSVVAEIAVAIAGVGLDDYDGLCNAIRGVLDRFGINSLQYPKVNRHEP